MFHTSNLFSSFSRTPFLDEVRRAFLTLVHKGRSWEVSVSIVSFRLDPGILFLLVFRFSVSKTCLKLLFPRLVIVQRKL